jgi:hypothetical protein
MGRRYEQAWLRWQEAFASAKELIAKYGKA